MERCTRWLEKNPLYVLLFATHPIFVCICDSTKEPPYEIVNPMLVSVAIALVAFGVGCLVFRNKAKAGLAAAGLTLWLFSCMIVARVVVALAITFFGGSDATWYQVFHVLFWVAYGLFVFAVFKANDKLLKDATYLINLTVLFLCVWDVSSFVNFYQSTLGTEPVMQKVLNDEKIVVPQPKAGSEKPDVYFIVLDGFSSEANLKARYAIDNDFFARLREKGFYVAADSYSNYEHTALSVSSALNLQYLNWTEETIHDNWNLLYPLMEDSKIARLFKSIGYRYVLVDSGTKGSHKSRIADQVITTPTVSEFDMALSLSTPWFFIEPHMPLLADAVRSFRLWGFQAVVDSVSTPSPKFVFAHINMPHYPYVFTQDGKPRPCLMSVSPSRWADREGYREMALFTEKKVLEMVNGIIANSKNPPVIIIMGDHGGDIKGRIYNEKPDPDYLMERHGIFNAYYLPNAASGPSKSLYSSISPVNSFRMLLRDFFNTDLSLLPDKYYFSPFQTICRVTDVTETINAQRAKAAARKTKGTAEAAD
jgi:hypothetical protein